MLCTHDARQVADIIDAVARRTVAEGLHAVGFISYEAAPGLNPEQSTADPGWLPLCWFALFQDCTHQSPPEPTSRLPVLSWAPTVAEDRFCEQVERIRDYIAAGDTYQVNFSYRLRAEIDATLASCPYPLFASMLSQQRDGYGAYIDTSNWTICCASHELFFERRGNRLVSRPMKGTVRRGTGPEEDEQLAAWLQRSAKNRAENLMITDMVRNDLGRIAETGSVRTEKLFELEPYPTLWQMTSTVSGRTESTLLDVLRALFPAASITGAPKHRTMELIRDLESEPRQIYTGSISYVRPDGSAQFNVAIRTALINKAERTAEYGVGGGIVWDSTAADEYQECRTKARIITHDVREFDLLETMLWTPDEGYRLLDEHFQRLIRTAAFFRRALNLPAIRRLLDDLAGNLATDPKQAPQRVRLLVSASGEGRVSAERLKPLPEPFRLALAPEPLDVIGNPYVAHKTTRRDLYVAARQAVPDADDVLLWNHRGELTESSFANVFLELDGKLVTPHTSSGLLPGIFRQALLDAGRATESVVSVADLSRAEAVYLGNSVRGLWQVSVDPQATAVFDAYSRGSSE